MIKIPNYLKEISNLEKDDDNSTLLSLKCTCGKNEFSILINKNDPYFSKRKKLYYDLINEFGGDRHCKTYNVDGDLFINYKGLRGFFTKPKIIDNELLYDKTKIVKAKCLHCAKEFLLYDNRIQETVIDRKREYCYSNFVFEEIVPKHLIKILLEYDLTVDMYEERIPFSNKKPYEDYYSYIKIFYNTDDNKEKKLFEDEF